MKAVDEKKVQAALRRLGEVRSKNARLSPKRLRALRAAAKPLAPYTPLPTLEAEHVAIFTGSNTNN